MNKDVMGVQEVSPEYELVAENPAVPVGYKQTEVGVIPEDWETKTLGSALRKGRLGGNYPNQGTASDYPLMKMGNLGRGYFDVSKQEYICGGVIPDEQHRLRYSDVVFNTRNTLDLVGKIAIWRDELPIAYYNSNLMRLEFDKDVVASNEYANYALNTTGSITRLRALATGTTSVAAIYTRDLLDFAFIVPPKPEQKAIATALSDVDALLEELDRLIAKKRDIKQAAMQQLLTGETRLPGFEGEWITVRASDIGHFRGGNGFPTRFQGCSSGAYPFLKVSDMNNAGNDTFIEKANHHIDEPVRKQIGAAIFPSGTIIFAKVGAAIFLERKKILTMPSCIDNNMTGYVLDSDTVDVRFIHYALLRKNLGDLVATTALPSLSGAVLASIELTIPPLEEQVSIATVLSDMDPEIHALEQRRRQTAELKQCMMQEQLNGRTRPV